MKYADVLEILLLELGAVILAAIGAVYVHFMLWGWG